MAMCAVVQDHLYVEMGMRCQDNELTAFSFSRERGLENNEPHLNGHYDMNTTATDKPLIVKKEHAWMKAILDRVTHIPARLVLKMIPASNRTYGFGYDFKDMARLAPDPPPPPPPPLLPIRRSRAPSPPCTRRVNPTSGTSRWASVKRRSSRPWTTTEPKPRRTHMRGAPRPLELKRPVSP